MHRPRTVLDTSPFAPEDYTDVDSGGVVINDGLIFPVGSPDPLDLVNRLIGSDVNLLNTGVDGDGLEDPDSWRLATEALLSVKRWRHTISRDSFSTSIEVNAGGDVFATRSEETPGDDSVVETDHDNWPSRDFYGHEVRLLQSFGEDSNDDVLYTFAMLPDIVTDQASGDSSPSFSITMSSNWEESGEPDKFLLIDSTEPFGNSNILGWAVRTADADGIFATFVVEAVEYWDENDAWLSPV